MECWSDEEEKTYKSARHWL